MAIKIIKSGLSVEYTDGTQSRKYNLLKQPKKEIVEKCNSLAELDFVLGLQEFKKGATKSEIVAYVTKNASIGLGRIQDLIEVAKNSSIPENVAELVIDSELKSSKGLESTYGDSLSAAKTPAEQDALFQAEFESFMTEFKDKFLANYFDDIKTLEPTQAREYLSKRFNPLAQAIVDQFDSQYGGKGFGLNMDSAKKLNAERDRRYQIVTKTVIKTLGDFFQEELDKVVKATGKKKEDIVANIQGYNEWQSHYVESTEFITEMQEDNKHVLEAATDDIRRKGRILTSQTRRVEEERLDVDKKDKVVKNLHTEAQELSKFLESLWKLQTSLPSRSQSVYLAETELAAEFPEEFKEYKRLCKEGDVPAARKKVEEAAAGHRAVKNTKKEPAAKKALQDARDALEIAKKSIVQFQKDMDKKGGFVGYLLTSCITQLEGYGLGDDTELSIKFMDVDAIEKLTEKISTLTAVLKEENQDLFEKVTGKQPGEI